LMELQKKRDEAERAEAKDHKAAVVIARPALFVVIAENRWNRITSNMHGSS